MIKCRVCGGNCDPGDLVNGICLECMEEERIRQTRQDNTVKIVNSPFYQMELNLEVNVNNE